jgi:hypothetical protein
MPLTVEEYRIGQLYMIAKHSLEQSEKGEGRVGRDAVERGYRGSKSAAGRLRGGHPQAVLGVATRRA